MMLPGGRALICEGLRLALRFVRSRGMDGLVKHKEAGMTAYLISLALAGLIAVALWEGFS